MNRRGFVTGLSSAASLLMMNRAFASAEPKSALERRVHAQLTLGVDDDLTIGAVMMVVQYGKVLALEAAGFADAATKTPMRTDAIFDIRSIRKPSPSLGHSS